MMPGRRTENTLTSLLAALVLLNLTDALLTVRLVGSGRAMEGNPVMAAVLTLGPVAFVAVKLVASAGLGALMARYSPSGLRVLCWAFGVIVTWNALLLLQ